MGPNAPTTRVAVSGEYRRKQGERLTYAYQGAYGVNSDGTWWLVTVRCDGKLKGTPMGMLEKTRSPTKAQIGALIETQIEGLDQVVE